MRKQFLVSISDPSVAATVVVGPHLSLYSGSLVQAQIEVGSERLLSLFPGIGSFVKAT